MDFDTVIGLVVFSFFVIYAIFGCFYKPGQRSKALFSYKDIQASYRKPEKRTDEDDFQDERKAIIHEWQEHDSSMQFCSRSFK